jgi:hypothetical protein
LIVSHYKIFGLIVKSEIELPELHSTQSQDIDVSIRIGNVDDNLPNPVGFGKLYETAPDDFIFKIDAVAKYQVRDGKRITIQPLKNATYEEIRLFLYGSVFGALLHQRGILPLHGSSIKVNDGALVFIGSSSKGKSTIAASLISSGYEVIADDISAISRNKKGRLSILPGIPYLKLWKDVLDDLQIRIALGKVRPQVEKYIYPVNLGQLSTPFPILKIILLENHNEQRIFKQQIYGAEKIKLLKLHTYRSNYIDGLGISNIQYRNILELAESCSMVKVYRPIAPLKINELKSFIEKEIIQNL